MRFLPTCRFTLTLQISIMNFDRNVEKCYGPQHLPWLIVLRGSAFGTALISKFVSQLWDEPFADDAFSRWAIYHLNGLMVFVGHQILFTSLVCSVRDYRWLETITPKECGIQAFQSAVSYRFATYLSPCVNVLYKINSDDVTTIIDADIEIESPKIANEEPLEVPDSNFRAIETSMLQHMDPFDVQALLKPLECMLRTGHKPR